MHLLLGFGEKLHGIASISFLTGLGTLVLECRVVKSRNSQRTVSRKALRRPRQQLSFGCEFMNSGGSFPLFPMVQGSVQLLHVWYAEDLWSLFGEALKEHNKSFSLSSYIFLCPWGVFQSSEQHEQEKKIISRNGMFCNLTHSQAGCHFSILCHLTFVLWQ